MVDLSVVILSNSDPITAERGIVLEARPGHGEVVFTHSEEAAKGYDSVSDFAADLVEHYPLNCPDLVVIPADSPRELPGTRGSPKALATYEFAVRIYARNRTTMPVPITRDF